MMIATFVVYGTPKAQPRVRPTRNGGVYMPHTADEWREAVARASASRKPKQPLQGPVRVDIDVFLPRPRDMSRKKDPDGPIRHTAKPDRDNLEKAIMDAMTHEGWWKDDSVVCDGRTRKFWHGKGKQPGACITVFALDSSDP